MREQSRKIALCGITGGLAATVMLMGGILPLATFCAPAIAGILIMPIAIEYGKKSGALLYVAISLLAIFLVPDKEMSLIFIFFLGYYPLLKALLEKLPSRLWRIIAKFCVFNASVLCMYGLVLFLFPLPYLTAEFAQGGMGFAALLLLMGNITFWIYDLAVARIVYIYCATLRPRLMKKQ